MRILSLVVANALLLSVMCGAAQAETKVTLTGMHLCCGGCVNGVKKAVKDLEGVEMTADSDAGSVTIVAPNDEAAQKAIDAIADAGFHGDSDHDAIKMKEDSGVKAGKLTRLELTGIHNCCGSCDRAVKSALKGIAGIQAVESKAKTDRIVIEGDFDGLAAVKALYEEGFHGKAKQ